MVLQVGHVNSATSVAREALNQRTRHWWQNVWPQSPRLGERISYEWFAYKITNERCVHVRSNQLESANVARQQVVQDMERWYLTAMVSVVDDTMLIIYVLSQSSLKLSHEGNSPSPAPTAPLG